MSMYLKFVKHDILTNTLEATWFNDTVDELGNVRKESVRCQSYSSEQKADFNSDTGTTKYTKMAGW